MLQVLVMGQAYRFIKSTLNEIETDEDLVNEI